MKKIVSLLWILIIFAGCRPVQLVVCKYSGQGRSGFGHDLTLNADNTFEYEVMRGWTYEHVTVSGTWKKEGDKLLIDSRDSLMQNFLPLSVNERMTVGEDSLKFILCIPYGNRYPYLYNYVNWVLVMNGISYPFINDSVISIIDAFPKKQFYLTAERNVLIVPLLNRETVRTQTYTLQNKHSDLVELSISLTIAEINRYAGYELLDDTLKIKRNKLIWPRKKLVLRSPINEKEP